MVIQAEYGFPFLGPGARMCASPSLERDALFGDYSLDSTFDEMRCPTGEVREHYRALADLLARLPVEELQRRKQSAGIHGSERHQHGRAGCSGRSSINAASESFVDAACCEGNLKRHSPDNGTSRADAISKFGYSGYWRSKHSFSRSAGVICRRECQSIKGRINAFTWGTDFGDIARNYRDRW